MDDYRERIAAVQHAIWSHWMRHLFSVCPSDSFGNVIISAEVAQRWQRQMNTDYADLTDKERESDRHQADKVLAERDAEIARLGAQLSTWEQTGNAIMQCAVGREAPLSDSDVCGEINALRAQVETMLQAQAYAENTILRQRWMMDAQKRTASDAIAERDASIARMERQLSDNLAKAEMLRAQVAGLQAWKDAVPVVGIKRLFRDAPYDALYADEVWQWIEKYTLNR